jgi:hypothetical protein
LSHFNAVHPEFGRLSECISADFQAGFGILLDIGALFKGTCLVPVFAAFGRLMGVGDGCRPCSDKFLLADVGLVGEP